MMDLKKLNDGRPIWAVFSGGQNDCKILILPNIVRCVELAFDPGLLRGQLRIEPVMTDDKRLGEWYYLCCFEPAARVAHYCQTNSDVEFCRVRHGLAFEPVCES